MSKDIYNYNNKCYYFKELNFDKGIFDDICDCCYVLLLENSSREKSLYEQLNTYKPHKKIIIQYNKGFKKCDKILYKQSTIYDINDCYYQVFMDAESNNFKNILVFEDDIIFDKKIKNKNIINDIKKLYKNYNVDIFNLGAFNYVYNPLYLFKNRYNCKKFLQYSGVHAVIYNKKVRKIYINSYKNNKRRKTFDEDINILKYGDIYSYKYPIAYQPINLTENMTNWSVFNINVSGFCIKFLNFFGILNSDKPIYAFNKNYFIITILNYIVSLIILIIIFKIFKIINKKK